MYKRNEDSLLEICPAVDALRNDRTDTAEAASPGHMEDNDRAPSHHTACCSVLDRRLAVANAFLTIINIYHNSKVCQCTINTVLVYYHWRQQDFHSVGQPLHESYFIVLRMQNYR